MTSFRVCGSGVCGTLSMMAGRGAEETPGRRDLDDQAPRQRRAPWPAAGAHREEGRPRVKGDRLPALATTADMTAKLRRVITAAKFKQLDSHQPEPEEIHAIRLAWEDALDLAA
ncbi:MAG TPA: hypothetical protein VGG75_10630 [Trebonia sp.]